MSRRIITESLVQNTALESLETGGAQVQDGYWDKVIKNIPADIVAGWTAMLGLFAGSPGVMPDTNSTMILWGLLAVFLGATFLWTYRQTSVPNAKPAWTQIIISTIAFAVWAIALGVPFNTLEFYDPRVAAAILIVWTIVVGAINPNE